MFELPAITGKQAIKAFEADGWYVARVSKSSHHVMKKDGRVHLLTIPVHGNKNLKAGLLRAQIRLAELTVEQFVKLLVL
ncbi:MAG: type II toxin-antitoxin system HicA family toxin [Pirellulales bacterium]|nr:type II toxin-antitoxin system HicA family toxin [Pirellulales bacterium]